MLGGKERAQGADAAGANDGDADIVLLHREAPPSARAYATCRTATLRRKRRRRSSSTSIPSPGRSETTTCPRAMCSGSRVTSSASPALVSVRPHAICGSAAAMWVAAAQAMLDSPVLAETLTFPPSRGGERAGRDRAAHPAELDGFEAPPARGMALVVVADVLERVDALIGADGDFARRGRDCRHAGKIIRRHGLLEKIKASIGDAAHVLQRLLRAPALIGVR